MLARSAQAFEAMGDYEDAPERALASHYAHADALLSNGEYDSALTAFTALGDYSDYEDAPERALASHYAHAEALLAAGDIMARAEFEPGDYESPERAQASLAPAKPWKRRGIWARRPSCMASLAIIPDARERSFALWEQVADRETVSAGDAGIP